MTPADQVLDGCTENGNRIHCWHSPAGHLEMALFIEIHPKESHDHPLDSAKAKLACRSFHHHPIPFRYEVLSEGGEVAVHDKKEKHTIMAGETPTLPFRSYILPTGVRVSPGPDGAVVEARLFFDSLDFHTDDPPEVFSVEFPREDKPPCPCC